MHIEDQRPPATQPAQGDAAGLTPARSGSASGLLRNAAADRPPRKIEPVAGAPSRYGGPAGNPDLVDLVPEHAHDFVTEPARTVKGLFRWSDAALSIFDGIHFTVSFFSFSIISYSEPVISSRPHHAIHKYEVGCSCDRLRSRMRIRPHTTMELLACRHQVLMFWRYLPL